MTGCRSFPRRQRAVIHTGSPVGAGPRTDSCGPDKAPIPSAVGRANPADSQIKPQEKTAIFDQEGMQLPEAAPLLIGNHHAQSATIPRLLNNVCCCQQASSRIGDYARAADASPHRLMILRTQQWIRGAQGRQAAARLRTGRTQCEGPPEGKRDGLAPAHVVGNTELYYWRQQPATSQVRFAA